MRRCGSVFARRSLCRTSLTGKDRTHSRLWRRACRRRRPIRGCVGGQRRFCHPHQRARHSCIRSTRDHDRPGHGRARIRAMHRRSIPPRRRRRRRADRWHRSLVCGPHPHRWSRAGTVADPTRCARRGSSDRRAGRRHRCGFAGAASCRRTDVSDCPEFCRALGAGLGRSDPQRSTRVFGGASGIAEPGGAAALAALL